MKNISTLSVTVRFLFLILCLLSIKLNVKDSFSDNKSFLNWNKGNLIYCAIDNYVLGAVFLIGIVGIKKLKNKEE